DIKVQQPWPIPIGLGGYLATLSWRGTVIAIVCAIVAFLIWYPFMKRFDLKTYKREQEEAKQNANA
ncbi:PTS sugar transporter subunit IIC, partial [Anaerostipes hadrus]|nr:PTS sugar transporter subunit IIC [Anaerostipes hadrus]